MRKLCHAFCLVLNMAFGSSVAAGTAPVPAIPFDSSEGLLWIQAQVPQSNQPLNFLFDTGSEVSVINSRTTAKLHFTGGTTIRVQGVDTDTTGQWPVRITAK